MHRDPSKPLFVHATYYRRLPSAERHISDRLLL
jgi:hypothetical protein